MKLLNKINSYYHNKILSRHSLSIEETGRRMLFVNFLLLLIIPLVIFASVHLKNGIYLYSIINYSFAAAFFILIIVLNYQKNAKIIYRLITICFGFILFYWAKTGAVMGYSSIWILTFPLYAFFLMGKKEGFYWTILCAILTVLVFINPFSFFSDFSYPGEYISRHLFTFFMIFLISYSYESIREKYKSAMEAEQAELLLEKDKLAEAKDAVDRANILLKE